MAIIIIEGCRGSYRSQNTYKYRLTDEKKEYLNKVGVKH